jgi:hypothetical protein
MQPGSDAWSAIILVHLAATWFMVGLIWTIHAVHYPLFAHVGTPYRPFQELHMRLISRLLAVPWAIEVLAAATLVVAAPAGTDRLLAVVGGVLVAAILAVTALWAAPCHGRLLDAFDPGCHRSLLRADLVRTVLWSARGALAAALVWRALGPV